MRPIYCGIALAFFFFQLANAIAEPRDTSNTDVERRKDKAGIAWRPVTAELLKRETSSGKNVMLIFVADWCAPSEHYRENALKSKAVAKALAKKRVTTLIADITEPTPELTKLMKELEVTAIPTTLIYPADKPAGRTLHIGIKEDVLIKLVNKLPVPMKPVSK